MGLINSSVGGTVSEAWTSPAMVADDARFAGVRERYAKAVDGSDADAFTGLFTPDGVFTTDDPTGAMLPQPGKTVRGNPICLASPGAT